jgi:hypothetical protein
MKVSATVSSQWLLFIISQYIKVGGIMLSVNALFYIQIKCFPFILGSFSMNN